METTEPLRSHPYACPRCGAGRGPDARAQLGYQCSDCGLELAHLDLAPNGTVRAVLGWLRMPREVLQERYQITAILGRGGFAATYLAEDLRLKGRRRALKEIPLILYDEAETMLLSRLQHPAIPDIVDRFEADQMTYLVLEFGGQRTLEDERSRLGGTIPVAQLLPWMRQLCDVLSYLHGQTPPIVHRDLKPENILLDERDRIMLIDFGIAKESGTMDVTRTIARSVSHGFSPPEQALGTGTDQRSDVYALGATMYALLTGQAPPAAHGRVAGQELVPPRALNPAITTPLEAAIIQALSLNMNHRQQSIRELGLMFEPGAVATAPPDRQAKPRPRTERLATTAPAARPVPATSSTTAPATDRHGDLRRLGYLVVPLLAIAMGALWFAFGRQSSEAPPAPATTSGAMPSPAVPAEIPPASAGGTDAVSPPSAAADVEPAPVAARPQALPAESGSATRALEEALASRPAPAILKEDLPAAPDASVVPVGERVRAALKAGGLGDVTVEVLGPKRVRLGNLATEAVATRAKEVAATVVDPGTTIEARVAQARVERARPPANESAKPAPADAGWGTIRREGTDRTD